MGWVGGWVGGWVSLILLAWERTEEEAEAAVLVWGEPM